jgi:hypothetical protein
MANDSLNANSAQLLRAVLVDSPGVSLDDRTRIFMESRFGRDFRRVRVHMGPLADKAASALNAEAFTFGLDVVFGGGKYRPQTSQGLRLLAHELTHVVQQGGTDRSEVPQYIGSPDDPSELTADLVAQRILTPGRLPPINRDSGAALRRTVVVDPDNSAAISVNDRSVKPDVTADPIDPLNSLAVRALTYHLTEGFNSAEPQKSGVAFTFNASAKVKWDKGDDMTLSSSVLCNAEEFSSGSVSIEGGMTKKARSLSILGKHGESRGYWISIQASMRRSGTGRFISHPQVTGSSSRTPSR